MRRHTIISLPLIAGVLAACGDDLPGESLTAMTYNLAQIDGGARAEAVAAEISATGPDFAAIQECVDCARWLPSQLTDGMAVIESRSGVAIAYASSRWSLRESGVLTLGMDDDGWGERVAQWGLFAARDGQVVYFYATHWCVTIRRPDDSCTVDRQLDYARSLVDHIQRRASLESPVLLAGDFNVFDGFEDGEVISFLDDSGLRDLFRFARPNADGTTFLGNSWAPSGRLDYVFSTTPVDVLDARIDGVSDASDHYPVVATVRY
jgi:endonuclease/exonuclease/phosphatase family metal-dependent hydrolase